MDTYISYIVETAFLAGQLEFTYHLPKFSWDTISLNRNAQRINSVSGISHFHTGFEWNNGDSSVKYWIPQGITGKRNGEQNASKKYLIVSWYNKEKENSDYNGNKGVRLSFIDVTDMDNISYRHVLIVQPSNNPTIFEPIPIHAGGIACIGDRLYIADTNNGMREFDLTKIFEVNGDNTKSICGFENGIPYAFDYLYILPQTRQYIMRQNDASFSWVSIDKTDPVRPLLFTGNYKGGNYDSNAIPTLSWWNLKNGGIESLKELVSSQSGRSNIQGGHIINSKKVLAKSGRNAKLFVDDKAPQNWANDGCEDLHYSENSDNLWSLTENSKRVVFAVKASNYL